MFFNNMFGNMQQPQQVPVMGAQGSPFAMPQQNMMMQQQQPMQQPLMMMQGGQLSQAPQQMQDMMNQQGGISFPSRWGER